MMIKQINKIKDFGIFKKFDWNNSIPRFNAFNILYGWNYSGKTTISRIFRCFETGQKHPDYLNATFELEDDEGNKFTENHLDGISHIRVFNAVA
jgi:wobble nucleotide-excising tRNase